MQHGRAARAVQGAAVRVVRRRARQAESHGERRRHQGEEISHSLTTKLHKTKELKKRKREVQECSFCPGWRPDKTRTWYF